AAETGLAVWAFCLMTNHVHLLAVPGRADALARGAGLAHRRHAAALNRRHGWTGHLWAGRFFSTPLDEAHLWAAVRYIELNPVRAGLVARAEEWPWSSACAHCGLAGADVPFRLSDVRKLKVTSDPDNAGLDILSPDRPFPGEVGDWARWLREPWDGRDEAALADDIRRCTRT